MRPIFLRLAVIGTVLSLSFSVAHIPVSGQQQKNFDRLDPSPYNPDTEPDCDLFIRSWRESQAKTTHGALRQYDIFFPLDTKKETVPAVRGNVLTALKRFTYGVINPGQATESWETTDEQNIYYITDGSGVVRAGGKDNPIQMDTFVVVPPNIPVSFRNTGTASLSMYIMTENIPKGFAPRKDVLVRGMDSSEMFSNRGHWTHCTGIRLTGEDGLAAVSSGMCPVWYMPGTIGQPHSHTPGSEEIWFVISGDFHLLMGKKFYHLSPGTAFKVPATGETPHANINLGDKPVKVFWMMKNVPGATGEFAALEPAPYDPGKETHPDMFISRAEEHNSFTTHGTIIERSILSKNTSQNPMRPTTRSAVLSHVERFTKGTLMAGLKTPATAPKGIQEIFYILEGVGKVTAGGRAYDLYPGVCFFVPEGLEFTMANSPASDMTMYIVAEKTRAGFKPRRDLLWRDSGVMEITSRKHWTYDCTQLVGKEDGLADLRFVQMVTLPPQSFAQPHSNEQGTEEAWAAIDKADFPFLIGKQLRTLRYGEAYLVPPDGKTFYANINPTDKPIRLFSFGRFEE